VSDALSHAANNDPPREPGEFRVSDPAPRLTIEFSDEPGGLRVELVGELDLETVPELDRRLTEFDATKLDHLVIDLSGVDFMDSTGLASIVRQYRFAESNGHTLTFRPGSSQVQRLLQITGLADRVTFEA
jgi:anti-sigma B factor antagonist